jgi:peroxiredoxin
MVMKITACRIFFPALVLCLAASASAQPAFLEEGAFGARGLVKGGYTPSHLAPCLTDAGGEFLPVSGNPAGKAAPGFTLKDSKGNAVSLSQFRGKMVLLDFWASFCPACREATGRVVRLHEEFSAKGLVVMGVDAHDDPEKIEAFAGQHGIHFAELVDESGSVTKMYRVRMIPSFFLIDADGFVVWSRVGLDDEGFAELRGKIQEGLKKAK